MSGTAIAGEVSFAVSHESAEDRSTDELRELVVRARDGDVEAFEVLYVRFERSIYGLCHHLLGSSDAAADAVQQTFVDVFERLGQLRYPEAFASWLRSAAVNACRYQQRRRWWQTAWSEAFGDEPPPVADPARLPDEEAAAEELSAELRRALSRLSPAHREVVVLHHLQERPLEEIADILGVAVGTVKSRLGRARQHLARLLRPYVEGEDEEAEQTD